MSENSHSPIAAMMRATFKLAESARPTGWNLSDEEETPRSSNAEDPAVLAIDVMLARALHWVNLTLEQAGRDGTVTAFKLPSVDWVRLALDYWQQAARQGQSFRGRFNDGSPWSAWAPTAPPAKHEIKTDSDEFTTSISQGRHCAGFASETSWLPPDLLQSADFRIDVDPLDADGLAELVVRLCGSPAPVLLSDAQAAVLNPRLLRLARRPGQTADAYVAKLAELVHREHPNLDLHSTKSVAESPRDEPTLARLHGMDEAVVWGENLARDLAAYRGGTLPWSAVDCGCLISGPPGCGKTLFARALAATCNVPLVSGSYGQWHGTGGAHQGDLLKAMRKTFADAKACAPSILFIDEVDSFPDRAKITHHYADWEIQVVNALLAEIDGVAGREGVILIGACNHPHRLDPALVRSGRLDRHIRIGLPDHAARRSIFREHLGVDLVGEDLGQAALLAQESTGADAERFVREARRSARTAGRRVEMRDLLNAIDGRDLRSQDDLARTAVHEAGHAVAAAELGLFLDGVSLVSTPTGGGWVSVQQRFRVSSAADIHDTLVFMLSGRAAEESILGVPTSGAGGPANSDLALATELATRAVSELGFDGERGLMWLAVPGGAADLRRMLQAEPRLAETVRRHMSNAYGDALTIAARRANSIRKLADVLLKQRAMSAMDVAEVLGVNRLYRDGVVCTEQVVLEPNL